MSGSQCGPGAAESQRGNVKKNEALHRFELEVDGHTAIACYRIENGVMSFTRTQTPPGLRNKGVASRLIQGALEMARAEGL